MSDPLLLPLAHRVGNAAVSYVAYVWKTAWPSGLAVLYPHPGESLSWWRAGAASLLLAGATAAVWSGKRRPYLPVGWFWFLGTLVPVIGLVQVGIQGMADRYTYIPLVGLFVMAVWGVADLVPTRVHRPAVLGTSAVVAVCIYMTAACLQAGYWSGNEALFLRALRVTSSNWPVHNLLGVTYLNQGRYAEAVTHLRESLRIRPYFPEAHHNLGRALVATGSAGEAILHYREALKRKPDYPEAHNNLGVALLDSGHPVEAMENFREAIRLRPGYATARYNLGVASERQRDIPGALLQYQEVLKLNPGHQKARSRLETIRAAYGMGTFPSYPRNP